MDKIRVSKVEGVTFWRKGVQIEGTLHLTSHHIIFSYTPRSSEGQVPGQTQKFRLSEIWITYPMIAYCIFRLVPSSSYQSPSVRLRCRDFTYVALHFQCEDMARNVYDSIKSLTCKLGMVEKLYAFSYNLQSMRGDIDGWKVYDAREEWKRLGIGETGNRRGWRISKINTDYQYSPTYPALLPVPSTISDNVLNYAGKYRSRARIPVLTYLHPINNCSITRSSQPLAGFRGNRSVQDEKLVADIFATNKPNVESDNLSTSFMSSSSTENSSNVLQVSSSMESSVTNAQFVDDQVSTSSRIYGAQQNNLIVDARPTVNAYAMQAVGLGSENMDNYNFATKAYLGIDNIHVMRNSLNKIVESLKDSDITPLPPNREQLARSGWLSHISTLLDGATLIAGQVGIRHSHVLIHCSDGWDRTSQLSALSQICLDPYYRTFKGFMVLVEKDWLSFGHMFRHRSGLLSSEKWFEIENERVSVGRTNGIGPNPTGIGGGANAFENVLLSAKGFFNKTNDSKDSLVEADMDVRIQDFSNATSNSSEASEKKVVTKVKETSPIFHQFLDATYQLLYQNPTRFEFNERFLRRLLYHLYSCQYGTFLYDSEKQRKEAKVDEKTRSVWDYFLSNHLQFVNEIYDPSIDERSHGKERLLFPRLGEIRWWAQGFGRADAEMNGPVHCSSTADESRS